ncbi:MAG: hypothetical protein HC817_10850 [Saprospiraceae bacterium]|nr:hypothetical protein [Saprospiraceae bacterium]
MDRDENIRCAAIRMARLHHLDLQYFANAATQDPSVSVKREALLALRHSREPQAPAIWAKLATQYDGKDRWYLEALGIAADENWDTYFEAWLNLVGQDWQLGKNRDIVWRSRAAKTTEMLTQLIVQSEGKEQLRYFRALDFQKVRANRSFCSKHLMMAKPLTRFRCWFSNTLTLKMRSQQRHLILYFRVF